MRQDYNQIKDNQSALKQFQWVAADLRSLTGLSVKNVMILSQIHTARRIT